MSLKSILFFGVTIFSIYTYCNMEISPQDYKKLYFAFNQSGQMKNKIFLKALDEALLDAKITRFEKYILLKKFSELSGKSS